MKNIALGINAAASAVAIALQERYPECRLVPEDAPDIESQDRFRIFGREEIDASLLSELVEGRLDQNTEWSDVANFLEQYVRICLVDQTKAFTQASNAGGTLCVPDGADPSDVYFCC